MEKHNIIKSKIMTYLENFEDEEILAKKEKIQDVKNKIYP